MFYAEIRRALTDESLIQILDLQILKKYLSDSEKESQGFVTAEHTFEQLKKINDAEPSVVIRINGLAYCGDGFSIA